MAATPKHCPSCGVILDRESKPRSTPQHRRQFAVFRAAFVNWGDYHDFRPKNESHLRRFLEVQAGHCEVVKTIRVKSVPADKLAAILTAVLLASDDEKCFVEADADLIVVKKAGSIAYENLGHVDACKLFDEIAAVLETYDLNAEQLLRERAA